MPDGEAAVVPVQLLLSTGLIIISLIGVVFVFLLAINVYSAVVGVLLGFLSFIPCLGLLILLMVNGKATSILRRNNIKVGLLGATCPSSSFQFGRPRKRLCRSLSRYRHGPTFVAAERRKSLSILPISPDA